MNILKSLTKKDLKLNRKRTIGTLIGIILATALIICVGGMFFVLQNTLFNVAIETSGYYHIQLSKVNEEDIKEIRVNKDISNIQSVNNLGTTFMENSNNNIRVFKLYSMNKNNFDNLKYNVMEGNFPKNENEILLPWYEAKNLGIKIGDNINIKIGDYDYSQTQKYVEHEEIPVFSNVKEYSFNVVGIINKDEFVTTNIDCEQKDVYLTLANPKNYKEDFNQLLDVKDYSNDTGTKYKYVEINEELLRWEVGAFGDETLVVLYFLVAIVIFIILVTSVFSIRNSFAISTTEKLKIYGMLSSIGATKKQIKKMVLYEGFKVGAIGIPFGAVFGAAVTYILTVIINQIASAGDLMENGFFLYYKFSMLPILLALVVGIIIIYLSTISSARKASKVAPIQNIRNASDLKNNPNLKVPGIIRKIFKIGGVISYKNLKRSKRKYRITVISLTISIFVFIIASSLLDYSLRAIKMQYVDLGYNVEVSFTDGKSVKDEDFNKLTSIDKCHIIYYENNKRIEDEGAYYLYDTSHILYDKAKINANDKEAVGDYIYYYDDQSFKEFADKINVNYENVKDKAIIINTTYDKSVKPNKYVKISDYKNGDKLIFKNEKNNKQITYEVGAVTEERICGQKYQFTDGLIIIVDAKNYKGDGELMPEQLYYETKDANKVEEQIKNISSNMRTELWVNNIDNLIKQMEAMILIFSIFIYGFIIVLTLIGVTSVFNTITSNMELRRSEFATFKSVGMTAKEFKNMIILESLFYSFKSLFFGIVLGIGGSYLVYRVFSGHIDFGYMLPFNSIIEAFIFVIILVYGIMRYSIKKTNNQNIIETIRNENI